MIEKKIFFLELNLWYKSYDEFTLRRSLLRYTNHKYLHLTRYVMNKSKNVLILNLQKIYKKVMFLFNWKRPLMSKIIKISPKVCYVSKNNYFFHVFKNVRFFFFIFTDHKWLMFNIVCKCHNIFFSKQCLKFIYLILIYF